MAVLLRNSLDIKGCAIFERVGNSPRVFTEVVTLVKSRKLCVNISVGLFD